MGTSNDSLLEAAKRLLGKDAREPQVITPADVGELADVIELQPLTQPIPAESDIDDEPDFSDI